MKQMYCIARGNGNFIPEKKSLEMILYSLRKHLNPHTREIIKGDGIKTNEPCVDWVIQCVLYHGVQVWIRLENLQTQN